MITQVMNLARIRPSPDLSPPEAETPCIRRSSPMARSPKMGNGMAENRFVWNLGRNLDKRHVWQSENEAENNYQPSMHLRQILGAVSIRNLFARTGKLVVVRSIHSGQGPNLE